MDFTKHRVQTNVEAYRLNFGKAVRHDSSTTGFKRMCIDLSSSSETCKDVERTVAFASTPEPGMHNGRVVLPGPWTDSLSRGTYRRALKAQQSSEVPRQGEGQRKEMTSNKEVFVHKNVPVPTIRSHVLLPNSHIHTSHCFFSKHKAMVPTDLQISKSP